MKKRKLTLAKGISISVLALVLVALVFNSWARNQQGGKDAVLVTVNDVKITSGEVDKEIEAMLGPQAKMLSPEKLAEIRDQLDRRVLDSIIVKTLLSKAIEEQNITVKDEEVDKVIKQLEEALPADVKFEEHLKNIGLAEDDLRQSLSKNLRIKKLLEQQVTDIAAVTDEEIKTYYSGNPNKFQKPENIEVRHILIAVKPDDDNAAKAEKMKKAEKIRQQLVDKKGENFEAIAAEVSDCPSKANGGKLGALVRGQAVKAFEDAAFNQNVGEIGPVVETSFGYHVIEVLDHKEATKISLSEVKGFISNYLIAQKKEKAVKGYIDALKAEASIVFHNEKSGETNSV